MLRNTFNVKEQGKAVGKAVDLYADRLVYTGLMNCNISRVNTVTFFVFPSLEKSKAFPRPSVQQADKYMNSFRSSYTEVDIFLRAME